MELNRNDELFVEIYKLNDNYHNTKDNFVWLCSLSYFTLSSSFYVWYFSLQNTLCRNQKIGITVALSVISIICLLYIAHQNWLKSKSVYITNMLNALLKERSKQEITEEKIVNIIECRFFPKIRMKWHLAKTLEYYQYLNKQNTDENKYLGIIKEIENSKKEVMKKMIFPCLSIQKKYGFSGLLSIIGIIVTGIFNVLVIWVIL